MHTLASAPSPETSSAEILAQPVTNDCFQSLVPDYALLFFDHLYSEYSTLRSGIEDQQLLNLLDAIYEKRLKSHLSWSNIYTFDLALIDERPLENLIRKAYDARAKYRSIAGQKEFDEYTASKPPDLTAILIAPNSQSLETLEPAELASPPLTAEPAEPNQPTQSSEIVQRVLRADIRYLLSKFYLYYAMLPMREHYREDLTTRAVSMTKWILALIVGLIVLSSGGVFALGKFAQYKDLTVAFGLTVGSVAFAGIVGGCVSMLQRIQSAPSEGDALFNLASLTVGWRGLSLSPLYGGIFASLLFILFAAGILQGSIFPKIETATNIEGAVKLAAAPPASASQREPAAPATLENVVPPTPTPTPLTDTQRTGILQIKDFLRQTGPKDGVSFALLIIWSFIAGFAERLVPDTLNRLVAKNQAIQGTNT